MQLKLRLSERQIQYLNEPAAFTPFMAVFVLTSLFLVRKPPVLAPVAELMGVHLAIAVLCLCRVRRAIAYGAALLALVVLFGQMTLVVSAGPQDSLSDRDQAASIAASALMRGENPWNHLGTHHDAISTSPTGILLSIPVVAVTGTVTAIALLFWIAIMFGAVWADLTLLNERFLEVTFFVLSPLSGFLFTSFWRLEELYWAIPLFCVIGPLLTRRRAVVVGAVCALIVFARLGYVYALAGCLVWAFDRYGKAEVIRQVKGVGLGFVLTSVALVAPFFIIGGKDFLARNFLLNATNLCALSLPAHTGSLSTLLRHMPTSAKSAIVLVMVVGVLLLPGTRSFAKRLPHPMWHVAVANLLAFTCGFATSLPDDYLMVVTLPIAIALALATSRSATTAS